MPVPRAFDGSLSPPRLVKACEKAAKARAHAIRYSAGDPGQALGRGRDVIARAMTGSSGIAHAGHRISRVCTAVAETTTRSVSVTVDAMAMRNLERDVGDLERNELICRVERRSRWIDCP